MLNYKIRFLIKQIAILSLAISNFKDANCQKTLPKSLNGTYMALWGETVWSYKFNRDSSYINQTSGHFGDINTKGRYKISNDTVTLTAFPINLQENPNSYFKTDTLIIDSDSCLIDLTTRHEHILRKNDSGVIFESKKRNLELPGRPIVIE